MKSACASSTRFTPSRSTRDRSAVQRPRPSPGGVSCRRKRRGCRCRSCDRPRLPRAATPITTTAVRCPTARRRWPGGSSRRPPYTGPERRSDRAPSAGSQREPDAIAAFETRSRSHRTASYGSRIESSRMSRRFQNAPGTCWTSQARGKTAGAHAKPAMSYHAVTIMPGREACAGALALQQAFPVARGAESAAAGLRPGPVQLSIRSPRGPPQGSAARHGDRRRARPLQGWRQARQRQSAAGARTTPDIGPGRGTRGMSRLTCSARRPSTRGACPLRR